MTFDTCAFDLKSSYDVSDTDEVVLMWFDELLVTMFFPITCSLKCVAHLISCTDRTAHGVGPCGVPQHT